MRKWHFVINAWDAIDSLPRCVMSILRLGRDDVTVTIVDNGSKDEDFVNFVNTFCEKRGVGLVRMGEFAHFTKARVAARSAIRPQAKDVLVFMNARDYLREGGMELLEELYSDPKTRVTYGDLFSHVGAICYNEKTFTDVISSQPGRVLADYPEE